MTAPPEPLSPALFAAGPARDARFSVVDRWRECVNLPPGNPLRDVEFLHRQMNEELNGLEASAQTLCDFPGAAWEIRLGLARQCADEARHAAMFRRRFEARGGRVGQFPVLNFQYRIIANIATLIGRLTVQNRSFEAGGIDAIDAAISAHDGGDAELQQLFAAQLADEILHVRFANAAIAALRAAEPRSVLDMGKALAAAAAAFREVMGREATEGVRYPAATAARAEAGFTDREIARAAELASGLQPRAES
jgi:uncharacterized ferritin-like protein (DUF455 family)